MSVPERDTSAGDHILAINLTDDRHRSKEFQRRGQQVIKTSAREAKLKNQAPSLQLTSQQMSRLTLGQY